MIELLHIAVVEDNEQDAKRLVNCLTRYAAQNGLELQITRYPDALKLINAYTPIFDVVFMDIEMPLMSGMEAAKTLREADHSVTLVFVTNMAQYAVEGYSVEAFDYILKPIKDSAFDLKLKRILTHVNSKAGAKIVIRKEGVLFGLETREITYVEVEGHYLNWHVQQGKVHRAPGTLKTVERQLPVSFCAISRWHIVNMQHIKSVAGDDVMLGEVKLQIGRAYKQKFLQAYAEYMVGGSGG